jgi:NitT/TauT family transport system ATP-binding protein
VIVLTVRPGRVREIVPVDIPRPRTLEVKRRPEFVAIVDQIWRLIEEEVRAGMLLAPGTS